MKIRGTPAHIAEKYLALARDAQSSGDHVLAENYLQHAEHYNRIIMAYREQFQQHGDMANGNGQRMRGPGEAGEGEDFGDEEGGSDDVADEGFPQPPMPQHHGGQPQHQGRQQGGYDNRDRPFRRDRDQGRFRDRDRDRFNDRGDRGDRGDRDRDRGDRGDRDRDRGERQQHEGGRQPQPQQDRQPEAPAEAGGGERRRDRFQQPHEQPEFLRRPVRRARSENNGEQAAPSKDESRD